MSTGSFSVGSSLPSCSGAWMEADAPRPVGDLSFARPRNASPAVAKARRVRGSVVLVRRGNRDNEVSQRRRGELRVACRRPGSERPLSCGWAQIERPRSRDRRTPSTVALYIRPGQPRQAKRESASPACEGSDGGPAASARRVWGSPGQLRFGDLREGPPSKRTLPPAIYEIEPERPSIPDGLAAAPNPQDARGPQSRRPSSEKPATPRDPHPEVTTTPGHNSP
jgi:hypothetical protein